MLQLLARRWWALALRGVIAVLFGLLTLFMPGVTLISLVLLFGFYAILDGVFDIVSAMKAPGHHHISGRGSSCDYHLDRCLLTTSNVRSPATFLLHPHNFDRASR
jgi:hypothetical protein